MTELIKIEVQYHNTLKIMKLDITHRNDWTATAAFRSFDILR